MALDRDPGDEDDETEPCRVARALAGWQFRIGPCRVLYAAKRLPPLPDHDPGDEQPRLTLNVARYGDLI